MASRKARAFRRSMLSICAVLLTVGMLAACSGKNETQPPASTAADQGTEQTPAGTYPLQTTETLTAWQRLNGNLLQINIQNFKDTLFGQELQKRTGIEVSYTHPASGQEKEQFNLMIASGELPDIIEYQWSGGSNSYPGGPEKAIQDKVILPLNDLIDDYAPNLKKLLAEDQELDRMIKTDEGQYYIFPMVRGSEKSMVFAGPMLRKDWLDELGLKIPTTIDEWETVLRAFKEKKGASAPLAVRYRSNWEIYDAFIGAFNTSADFYVDDNAKIRFGPMDPQFKDALALLHKWYAEGLIDKDFAISDSDGKIINNKMTNGAAGATVALLGGGMGTWMDVMASKDPAYSLVGAPYPTLKAGDRAFTGQRDSKYNASYSAAVTTGADNPELAVRWLDYAYGEEGNLLFNYGIEGESYTMNNGIPVFSDTIMKNEQYTLQQMLSQYTKQNGPYIFDEYRNTNKYKEQDEAIDIWSETDAAKHLLPPVLTPTQDETKEISQIMSAINSYKEEMFVKFVMGKEPVDNVEAYQKQLEKMGINRAIEIYQSAYERYLKR